MQIIPLNLDSVLLLLHNSKLAYWLINDSMTSLFACGRFSKSRGLSASVSFLPSPSPPPSFTHSIHRPVILCSRTAQKRLLRRLDYRKLVACDKVVPCKSPLKFLYKLSKKVTVLHLGLVSWYLYFVLKVIYLFPICNLFRGNKKNLIGRGHEYKAIY